jgi:hypothetical protein
MMQAVSLSRLVNQASLNFPAISLTSMSTCVDQQIEKEFYAVSVLMALVLQQLHQNLNAQTVQVFLLHTEQ